MLQGLNLLLLWLSQQAPSSIILYKSKMMLLVLLVSIYGLFGCAAGATGGSTPATATQVEPAAVQQAAQHQQPTATRTGQSRGYLTTPDELAVIRQKADDGIEPYQSAVAHVLKWADRKWEYSLKAYETCKGADKPSWIDEGGVGRLYARALAYHLTNDQEYAKAVKAILQRMMTEVHQIDVKQQQCRLNFGWGTPELVAAADLVEAYWHDQQCTGPTQTTYTDTTIGSGNCKTLFQNWLVKNPYYIVSYTAEEAQSNWGAAATNTLAYIADYLADRQGALLIHRVPDLNNRGNYTELALTAAQAYARANKLMLDRMNGYGIERHSSNSCDYLAGVQQSPQWAPVKSQISEKGIIPEDARREEQCNIPRYNGEYQNYPQIHLGNNIQQCELLLRRGNSGCYDNIDNTERPNHTFLAPDGVRRSTHLYPGRGSIERAIKAIIVDAQTEWRHDAALEVAYRYYYHRHTLPGFESWFAQLDRPDSCDQDICFGTLTHGFAANEKPTRPPTIAPPQ